MARTVVISETTYARLADSARRRGLAGVEELLEQWPSADELRDRRDAVSRIEALREQLAEKYGPQPDSAALLRDDRDR